MMVLPSPQNSNRYMRAEDANSPDGSVTRPENVVVSVRFRHEIPTFL
jgi:hypothetical protein